MNLESNKQELSNDQIKVLLRDFGLTYAKLARIFSRNGRPRKRQQISDAINTDEQPTLRNKIIKHLNKKISNGNLISDLSAVKNKTSRMEL